MAKIAPKSDPVYILKYSLRMRHFIVPSLVAFVLYWITSIRTDQFSLEGIQTPLFKSEISLLQPELYDVLSHPFHYLGKGRQCFVFESEDKELVLKFFNRNYLEMPWYSFLRGEKEKEKRALRKFFYEKSYPIAFKEFGEEIVYLHLGYTEDLPKVAIVDRAGRDFEIDLNRVSFVLQRKGDPIYPTLEAIYQKEGLKGLEREIDCFLSAVNQRIAKGIVDRDTDVEHNWGYRRGKLFHLDPGRLYYDEGLKDPERIKQEWHNATSKLHKWLKKEYPEGALYLQKQVELHKDN